MPILMYNSLGSGFAAGVAGFVVGVGVTFGVVALGAVVAAGVACTLHVPAMPARPRTLIAFPAKISENVVKSF